MAHQNKVKHKNSHSAAKFTKETWESRATWLVNNFKLHHWDSQVRQVTLIVNQTEGLKTVYSFVAFYCNLSLTQEQSHYFIPNFMLNTSFHAKSVKEVAFSQIMDYFIHFRDIFGW